MDIIITESQLKGLVILEAYSQGLINKMINKYKSFNPDLSSEEIKEKIARFQQISSNVEQKDITKYSWDELTSLLDSHQPKRIKAGKIDKTNPDLDMIYNKDGIRIYRAITKKACIKYGNGYNFCISSRGTRNKFEDYRVKGNATPYFIFNDNLTTNKLRDGSFEDPRHLLVLMVYDTGEKKNPTYSISNADNTGEVNYPNPTQIFKIFPWLKEPFQQKILKVELIPNVEIFRAEKKKIEEEYDWFLRTYLNNMTEYITKNKTKILKLIGKNNLEKLLFYCLRPNFAYDFFRPDSLHDNDVARKIKKYVQNTPHLKRNIDDFLKTHKHVKEMVEKLRKILFKP